MCVFGVTIKAFWMLSPQLWTVSITMRYLLVCVIGLALVATVLGELHSLCVSNKTILGANEKQFTLLINSRNRG